MGELKARDIIPGWPRGRSTSRPLASELQLYRAGVLCVLYESNGMTAMGVDHRWMQDWADREAEERRKADMMEAWRQIERDGFREMIVLNLSHLLISECVHG